MLAPLSERLVIDMKVLFIRANPVRPDSRVEKEVAVLNRLGYEVSVLCWDRSDNYPLRVEPLNETDKSTKAYRIGIKTGFGLGMKNLKYLIRFQKSSLPGRLIWIIFGGGGTGCQFIMTFANLSLII